MFVLLFLSFFLLLILYVFIYHYFVILFLFLFVEQIFEKGKGMGEEIFVAFKKYLWGVNFIGERERERREGY